MLKTLTIRSAECAYQKNRCHCELTDEMNNYLLGTWKEHLEQGYHKGTYIEPYDVNEDGSLVYSIRLPGSTRGHIETDANLIIVGIEFYKDLCYGEKNGGCYSETMEELKVKYIGCKVVIL